MMARHLTDEEIIRQIRDAIGLPGFPAPPSGLRSIMSRTRPTLHLGITGSRELTRNRADGSDDPQYFAIMAAVKSVANSWLAGLPPDVLGLFQVHHGMCTGADEAAHWAARILPNTIVHGHPGFDSMGGSPYRMHGGEFDVLHPAKPYRYRNTDIVKSCPIILAAPAFPEHHGQSRRSGTWQTVRIARAEKRTVIIVRPDGVMTADREG